MNCAENISFNKEIKNNVQYPKAISSGHLLLFALSNTYKNDSLQWEKGLPCFSFPIK